MISFQYLFLKPEIHKTFLAVFDGFNMSKSTLDHAIQMTQVANASLVGIFPDDAIYCNNNVTKVIRSNTNYDERMKELDAKDRKKRDEAAQQFQKVCSKAGIRYSIHRDKDIAINALKQESMFADLMVINESETLARHKQKSPTRFMKDLLSDVQCSVLVVPDQFKPVDKVVLLYDGGPSSLYAIKMFSYLFGASMGLPVEVITVKEHYVATSRVTNNKLMREFIKGHFPRKNYTKTRVVPKNK